MDPLSYPPQRAAATSRWPEALRLASYIALWYLTSIVMTLYNKWLFSVREIRFPLLVTSLHLFGDTHPHGPDRYTGTQSTHIICLGGQSY